MLAILIVSSRSNDMAARYGTMPCSSCDVEIWREFPPRSGVTLSRCMLMSASWYGVVFTFKGNGWLGRRSFSSSSLLKA